MTFDGGHTVFVGPKLFWLVRSEHVWVQGLSEDSDGKLVGLAFGGNFMGGHRLVVRKGNASQLEAAFDGQRVLRQVADQFHWPWVVDAFRADRWQVGLHNDDILKMRTERQFDTGPWPERFLGEPAGGIWLFRFPGGVEVTVTGVDLMSAVLTMSPQPGGQGGFCGNFNGSPDDDQELVAPSWNRPIGQDLGPVPQSMSLFEAGVAEANVPSVDVSAAAAHTTIQAVLRQLKNCEPSLKEAALEKCQHAADMRLRRDCIFDVCVGGDVHLADSVIAAGVLERKVNSRGIPVFFGRGRCLDSLGQQYTAFEVELTSATCTDVLRSLAMTWGVMAAQAGLQAGSCQILVQPGVDPTGVEIQGLWTATKHMQRQGQGLISAASGDSDFVCWQLA